MDKSEPALVPQWLKGASGSGSGSTTPHSSSSLQSGRRASHNDYDSSRYFTLTDRTPISSSRRGPSTSGGTSDRSNHDRAYASFSRSSSFRGYDAPERDRDWERDIDLRDRENHLEEIIERKTMIDLITINGPVHLLLVNMRMMQCLNAPSL